MAISISWGTIKSLLIFFGPLLLPKIISYYRSFRAAQSAPGRPPVRPLPPAAFRSVALLLVLSLAYLVKLLPVFAPENIFALTNSRLQIPTDVLFTRLSALRSSGGGGPAAGLLTPSDEALRGKFVNLESRLLYLAYGPDALSSCPFCASDEPSSYLLYALPAVLGVHLVNLAATTLATSSLFTGGRGGSGGGGGGGGPGWRTLSTMAAGTLAALDVYMLSTFNHQGNARALRLADVDFFHWRLRLLRLASLSLLDAGLAALVYLSSTNRLFPAPPGPAARVEAATRTLASARGKLNAAGIVKNTASRDAALRARAHAYWAHEVGLMGEVMEEREVVEGIKDALEGRIDVAVVERDADAYARGVMASFSVAKGG